MTEVLAIFEGPEGDGALLDALMDHHPVRVTVLLDRPDAPSDWGVADAPRQRALRDRLSALLTRVETVTGAAVIGLAGNLAGVLTERRYDAVVQRGMRAAV
jgi:hypothetical protein